MQENELQEFIELIDELLLIDVDTDTFYGVFDGEYFKVSEVNLKIEEVTKEEVINFYRQKECSNELQPWEKQACLSCHLLE